MPFEFQKRIFKLVIARSEYGQECLDSRLDQRLRILVGGYGSQEVS